MTQDPFAPPTLELSSREHAVRLAHLIREIDHDGRDRHAFSLLRRVPRRAVVPVTILLALAITGSSIGYTISVLREDRALHRQISQRPVGQPVQITSGAGWALVAWQSDAGLCLDLVVPGNGATDCGIPVAGAETPVGSAAANGPRHEVAYLTASGENGGRDLAVAGVAASDVRRVVINLSNGAKLDPQMFDSAPNVPGSVRFFFADVASNPAGGSERSPLQSVDAYDASGHLLEHLSAAG